MPRPAEGPLTLLLSEWAAHQGLERARAAVGSGLRALLVRPDGSIAQVDDGCSIAEARVIGADEVGSIDVAWMTMEMWERDHHQMTAFARLALDHPVTWFQSSAAGTDAPLFRKLLDQGVRLTTSRSGTPPIAEYVVGNVLAVFQDHVGRRRDQADRRWRMSEAREVDGSRWLVIGLGSIGGSVAAYVRAMGAHVTGVRRAARGDEPVDALVTPDAVRAVLPHAEVVVLTAPLTDETRGMVDDDFLAQMRSDAVLVNISRGPVVDEDALRRALDAGQLAQAVLDVTEVEPLPADHWLWEHPKVVLTAHTAGMGTGRYERATVEFLDNLARFLADEPLVNQVG